MNHIELSWRNGAIKDTFDKEVLRRVRLLVSDEEAQSILANSLVDTDKLVNYAAIIKCVKKEVISDIEKAVNNTVDVGFDPDEEPAGILQNVNALLGITKQSETQAAEQLRRAIQIFAGTLGDEVAVEISYVYESWTSGRAYHAGVILKHGLNAVGDPQLYKVVSNHTSQVDWAPELTPALYTPIGIDNSGHPVWARPTGAHDAYAWGDVVNYKGDLYRSLVNGNVYSPDEYPAGWAKL